MTVNRIDTIGRLAFETHDELEQNGWCQKDQQAADGRVCLGGAVNIVAYGTSMPSFSTPFPDEYTIMNSPAIGVLRSAMVECGVIDPDLHDIFGSLCPERDRLWVWNDYVGRTDREVKSALRRVMLEFPDTPCNLLQEEAGVL